MKPFNAQKFILYCIAGLFAIQFSIYLIGAVSCYVKINATIQEQCNSYDDHLQKAFESALTTVLALLVHIKDDD
jgi:uncharacterized membrane protein